MTVFGGVLGFIGVVVVIDAPAISEGTGCLAQLTIITAALSCLFISVFGHRFKVIGDGPLPTAFD